MSVSAPVRHRMRLLGAAELVDAEGRPLSGVGTGKPLALLAYLAVGGPADRAELVELLWGESPEANARNAFRQILHRLRSAVPDVLVADGDELRVRLGSELTCDVPEFEEHLVEGRLEEAVALYGGDFLGRLDVGEPSFAHWAEAVRERLRSRQRAALETLVRSGLAEGRLTEAALHGQALTEIAPLDADAAALHAQALTALGRKAEAAEALRALLRRLRDGGDDDAAETPPAVRTMLERLGRSGDATESAVHAARTPREHGRASFFGRTRELGRLLGAWEEAKEGTGGTVLVTGPTGIGKSRLLSELAQRLPLLGDAVVLRGSGRLSGAHVPYAEIAGALRPLLDAPGLAGASTHLLAEAARLLPDLRDRFELPATADVADEAARVRFYEGVAAMLEAVAFEMPICLIVDDVQRASPASLDLMVYLTARLRGSAVLIVLAFGDAPEARRPLGRFRAVLELGPGSRAATLELGGLEEGASLEMAAEALHGAGAAAGAAERVAGVAGGHPLRLLDAARRAAAGGGSLAPPASPGEILSARFALTSSNERRVLVVAALLGGRSPAPLLAAAAHLPPNVVDEMIPRLVGSGLLGHTSGAVAPASEAAADAVLSGMEPGSRPMFSQWAADAAVAHGGVPDAVVASLYSAAGMPREALRHERAAGRAAAASGAFEEAAEAFTRALELARAAEERAELERLLEALGRAPTRKIAAGHAGVAPPAGSPAPAESPTTKAGSAEPARQGLPRRWRVPAALVGIGVLGGALVMLPPPGRGPSLPPTVGVLADTLLLGSGFAGRAGEVYFATGDLGAGIALARVPAEQTAGPAWVDSIRVPWMNPLPSPGGRWVALERASSGGTELYVISADTRDTVAVPRDGDDLLRVGWSPDGAALLALRTSGSGGEGYASELLAFDVGERRVVPLDTAAERRVTHAAWSPTGLHVAWIAREPAGNAALWVSDADGAGRRRLVGNLSDDQALSWDAYGTAVAFLRVVDGDEHIHLVEVGTGAVRRLTFVAGDHASPSFSPDGRFLAFERRDSAGSGVYVMASLGGDPRPIAPPAENLSLLGWRGSSPGFLERLDVEPPLLAGPGDRGTVRVDGIDQRGEPVLVESVRVTSLDPSVVRVEGAGVTGGESSGGAGTGTELVAEAPGVARLEVRVGGWRGDTVSVRVGRERHALLDDRFAAGVDDGRWLWIGPRAAAGGPSGGGVVLAGGGVVITGGGGSAASGLLSEARVPLAFGLELEASVRSSGGWRAGRGGELVFGLTAPESRGQQGDPDRAPLPIVAMHWLGDAGRFVYSVGRESSSEPAEDAVTGETARLRIEIDHEGRARFLVDGVLRWQSSSRASSARAQLWIGGRGGAGTLTLTAVEAALPGG